MKLPWSRKAKRSDPRYVCILIKGVADASPDPCRLKHKDWVCWVNPKSRGGKAFAIKFAAKSPLKDVHGKRLPRGTVIQVGKGAPSCWYQFLGGVKKGDEFDYNLTLRSKIRGPIPPPGPVIIADD